MQTGDAPAPDVARSTFTLVANRRWPPVSMPRSAPRPQAAAHEAPDDLNQGITDDDVPF